MCAPNQLIILLALLERESDLGAISRHRCRIFVAHSARTGQRRKEEKRKESLVFARRRQNKVRECIANETGETLDATQSTDNKAKYEDLGHGCRAPRTSCRLALAATFFVRPHTPFARHDPRRECDRAPQRKVRALSSSSSSSFIVAVLNSQCDPRVCVSCVCALCAKCVREAQTSDRRRKKWLPERPKM